MKLLSMLTVRALLPLILFLSLAPTPTQAQILAPVFGPYKIKFETSVAAGAVVNSDVLDLEKLSINQIVALVDNSAGAGARVLTFKCLAKNGTTVLFTSQDISVSNVAPGNGALILDTRISSATAATRSTVLPFPACPKMSFHIAAAGAAAVGLAVYAR